MHIALVGNISEGFRFVGPFDTFEDAEEWDYGRDERVREFLPVSWIAEMEEPGTRMFAVISVGVERVMEVTELNRAQAHEILRRLPEAVENSTIPEALDEVIFSIARDMED